MTSSKLFRAAQKAREGTAPETSAAGSPATTGAGTPENWRALVHLLNTPPWVGGITRWTCRSAPAAGPVNAIIAIPAHNEQALIESCLEACARSATVSGLSVQILVLVNGTTDDTVDRALAWAARRQYSLTLIDVDFAPPLAHAGAARRLALDIASSGVPPGTLLMTTDADAKPQPGWVLNNAMHLYAGAALVCGQVFIDPDAADRLPARVQAAGDVEGRYKRASLKLEDRIDPDPCNPWPHHGMASGASLAIRAGELARVGGMPLLPSAEDKALAREVRAYGLPVRHANDVAVEVSSRMVGRARGGMADALLERTRCANPLCDEALEPAALLQARLLLRARLRALWPSRQRRHDALLASGLDATLALALSRRESFAQAWAIVAQTLFASLRKRLRVDDLHRELPDLLALLARFDSPERPGSLMIIDEKRLNMLRPGVVPNPAFHEDCP